MAAHGFAAPAVEQNYLRPGRCVHQLGDTPQRVPVLYGPLGVSPDPGELRTAQALARSACSSPSRRTRPGCSSKPTLPSGVTFLCRGEFVRARVALEQGVALYQPSTRR